MAELTLSTGVPGLDAVIGGIASGDNIVWGGERTSHYRLIEHGFLTEAGAAGRPVLIVATRRSDRSQGTPNGSQLIDATASSALARPGPLVDAIERALVQHPQLCIVIDGLDQLARRWGSEQAWTFFERMCPTMLQAGALAYWRMDPVLGSDFLERARRVTQCFLALRHDSIHIVKAEGRSPSIEGLVLKMRVVDDSLVITPDPSSGRLARGLAAVRQDLGLTQAQMAAAAGVTASAISQAESGARGLSVDTLITLGDRLGVTLDRLTGSPTQQPGHRLVRSGATHAWAGAATTPLNDDLTVGIRAYLVSLDGGDRSRPSVVHHGAQLIVVLEGLVQVEVGVDTPVLRAGDSLVCTSATIHAWRNLRPEHATFCWVLRD